MNNVVNNIILALTALVVATAATEPITGRSSRWDQMIRDHGARHKRQTGREWRTIDESCNDLGDLTRFDQLGRRNSDLLAPVGNQGCCGSCWAFAAAHAVTDTRNLAAGRRLDLLSAQYTARCAATSESAATSKSGYGCCGGWPVKALAHYRDTGVATDVCLPYNELSSLPPTGYTENYKAANPLTCFSTCADGSAFDPRSITIDDINILKTYDEGTIINALSNRSVVVTPMEWNMDLHNYYRCGVLTPSDPPSKFLGYHSVVIVDYGTTNDTGTNFWVIKNSYGSNRGERGYFRVRRRRGEFGIGNYHMHIPLIYPDSTSPPSEDPITESQETCALEAVTEPQNNEVTMSAVEFALQGLADNQRVQCGFPPNRAATRLNLISFDSAGIQVVAGTMVELIVDVSLEGCGANVTKTLDLTVFINLDGMFTLTDYSTASAKILTASMLLLFAMVMINLVINN